MVGASQTRWKQKCLEEIIIFCYTLMLIYVHDTPSRPLSVLLKMHLYNMFRFSDVMGEFSRIITQNLPKQFLHVTSFIILTA